MDHDWKIYSRGAVPLHRLEIPIEGIRSKYKKFFRGLFKSVLYINIGPTVWWGWDKKEVAMTGKYVLEQALTEQGRQEQFKTMQEVWERGVKSAREVFAKGLTKLSDEELAHLYKTHNEECYEAASYLNVLIDIVDLPITDEFKELLRKELKDENAFIDCLIKLSAPTQRTFVKEEELTLLKIADRIKREGLDVNSGEVKGDIDELLKRFWWTSIGWENIQPQTRQDMVEKIKGILEVVQDPAKAIKEIDKQMKRATDLKKQVIDQHGLSEKLQAMIDLFDEWAVWHDKRKEGQVMTLYASHLMITESARRRGYPVDDLEWFSIEENLQMMKGKALDPREVNRRKQAIGVLVEGEKRQQYSGKDAKEFKERIIKEEKAEGDEFRGDPASRGRAKGIARVCKGAEEAASKIKQGDILVCGMTAPEYVPIMKKAAAIVTDDGGITCHAAVISRELGVPCIVGTHVSTSKVKDGDLVEVDADNGVIRILKRAGKD